MTKRLLTLALILGSFAAMAPAAVVYGRGYGYARPGVRVGVYASPYYYGPRVYAAPYVAPAYPAYVDPYYGYGYGYGVGLGFGYGGGYYRGGGGYYRGGGGYYRGGSGAYRGGGSYRGGGGGSRGGGRR